MLRRLALRDFVIVTSLEVELDAGFTVLTGETGAGKSILVDALQLALGSRGDAGVVREGAARTEITAEFDAPPALAGWLDEAGFAADDDGRLLLRRTIDAQGKSRAWINGSTATVAQLREAERIEQDRLARPVLPGEHAETRFELQFEPLDEHDIVDGNLPQHATCGPPPRVISRLLPGRARPAPC